MRGAPGRAIRENNALERASRETITNEWNKRGRTANSCQARKDRTEGVEVKGEKSQESAQLETKRNETTAGARASDRI